ncbi:MAG TPA: substrate-binding domain-containing protein [Burkholderiales bacterium]|nr:substrate-binding domain-containing protein [Burkholderiales bacterium]
MNKIVVRPAWLVSNEAGDELDPQLFPVLQAIHDAGKLTLAAEKAGLSYRHAWNLIGRWSAFFGSPLVNLERGRGTTLTPLGEKLLWAEQRINARLAPQLESLASELNLEIAKLVTTARSTLRIHASHGFAVAKLPELLRSHSAIQLDLRYLGAQESLASVARGACEFGGFHVPEGRLGEQALAQYAKWLMPGRQKLVHLVTRTQGLFLARGNPKNIRSFADLARPGVVFINRQRGSGTRLLIDQLLEQAGVDHQRLDGYQTEEFTHAAIAAYVASGMADAGFGVEPPARQFNLDFIPVTKERYFLICRDETLQLAEAREFIGLLRGAAFRSLVAGLAGYTVPEAGEVADVAEVFPALEARGPAR